MTQMHKCCGDYPSVIILGVKRWDWRYLSFINISFTKNADNAFALGCDSLCHLASMVYALKFLSEALLRL